MDQTWDVTAWKPTVVFMNLPGYPYPEDAVLVHLRDTLIKGTTGITEMPYEPSAWLSRAITLSSLGYYELAAGDAFKAIKLCEAGFQSGTERGASVRQMVSSLDMQRFPEANLWNGNGTSQEMRDMVFSALTDLLKSSYRLLTSCLTQLDEPIEARALCRAARILYPTEMDFVEKLSAADARLEARTNALRRSEATEEKVQFALRWGHVLIRKYPWTDSNLLERSSELVDTINNELPAYTNCMVIRESPIGASVSSATTALNTKCLGYFATRDIRAGEEIMYAPTIMSAHNRQMSGYCYNCPQELTPVVYTFPCCHATKFCSSACLELARANYHNILCGKDFSGLYASGNSVIDSDDPKLNSLLWLRILACCVQTGLHPLETPWMAKLTAQCETEQKVGWSYQANIVTPYEVLEKLGVDVFTDTRYDSWVLSVMWHRIVNNIEDIDGGEGVYGGSINERYSLFNHSCEYLPMMICTDTFTWTALRAIHSGEEVCTSYLSGSRLRLSKEARNNELKLWLSGECGCAKCQSEVD